MTEGFNKQVEEIAGTKKSPAHAHTNTYTRTHTRVPDLVDQGWGLRICICQKFQVMLTLLVWGPHFEKH